MLRNYIKIAWKVLKRNPFFTFVSLFGISLTIGILLVLATLFDQIAGRHYPQKPNGYSTMISMVTLSNEDNSSWSGSPSFYMIENYIKTLQSPKRIALISEGASTNSFVGDKKMTFQLKKTCEVYWDAHAYVFLEGKPYQKEHIDEKAYVAVITRNARDEYFGKDVQAVGKFIETDNTTYQVLGVVESVSEAMLIRYADIYVPYSISEHEIQSTTLIGSFNTILEAETEDDIQNIKEEYKAMVARLEVPPPTEDWQKDYDILSSLALNKLERLSSGLVMGDEPQMGLLTLFITVAMLIFMLLPALNLVNLNSSRIMERASEIGVRKAFGGNSIVLAFQFIVENILVTLLGGAIGLIIAWGSVKLIASTGVIKHAQLGINIKIFLFALFICMAFGILSGVLPAWRMSKLQVVNALKGTNL